MASVSIQALRREPDKYAASIVVRGVTTGHASKGFFLQEKQSDDELSSGIFVYSPQDKPAVGHLVETTGRLTHYQARSGDKVCLQLKPKSVRVLKKTTLPNPIELDLELLATAEIPHVARYLARLEGMRVEIPAGLKCVAPSNLHGDYVVAPSNWPGFISPPGGVLISPQDPNRWIPSFRVLASRKPLNVFVGDTLENPVVGALNYRASAYQVAASSPVKFSPGERQPDEVWDEANPEKVTVMTLNTFNLDPKIERKKWVNDPQMDVDDDVGQRQYRNLARAIIDAGGCPDIVALQEIQDDDGAEITDQTSAHGNLKLLTAVIKDLCDVEYEFLDSPPELHAEGGQPGGNIRNAYLYRAERVAVSGKVVRLAENADAFEDSRKPVMAKFRSVVSGGMLSVINVHLASKRHQHSIFADGQPGFDPREVQRIAQCAVIENELQRLNDDQQNYYVTGDFNDYEFSRSLKALVGDHSFNLVDSLPTEQRFDYNHRGRLLALMHGVISNAQRDRGGNRYQILHGNELAPVDPGSTSSDHAYVLAELDLGEVKTQ